MDGGMKAIDWPGVLADLAPIECVIDRALVRQKSRDFFWYSPVLNERLKGVRGDLVVCPANEDEVVRTLAYCHAHRIPVTPREPRDPVGEPGVGRAARPAAHPHDRPGTRGGHPGEP